MRHSYNSFDFWQNMINANKTIRGHMFMNSLPTSRTIYIHSLIFCKDNGLSNTWGYLPDEMALVGYIQYSFLQEAFYQWIYSKDGVVSCVPAKSVEEIIKEAERKNKVTKKEANDMRRHVEIVKKCWNLPKNKIINELNKFARDFNRTWYGDHTEFLYFKIFKTPSELGEFVVNSSYMSNAIDEFQIRTHETVDQWKEICEKAITNKKCGEEFRDILLKNLTEVL